MYKTTSSMNVSAMTSRKRLRAAVLAAVCAPVVALSGCSAADTDASHGDASAASSAAEQHKEHGAGSDYQLVAVVEKGGSSLVGTVEGGEWKELRSANSAVRPVVIPLADDYTVVADATGVYLYDGAMTEKAAVATAPDVDVTPGFITQAVASTDGKQAAVAYAVGSENAPDAHIIVSINTQGEHVVTHTDTVPVGLTQCTDGHVSWLEATSPDHDFTGGELGADVAVSRVTADSNNTVQAQVLPAGPAPVWGVAGCGEEISYVGGEGTAVQIKGEEATRSTVDELRSLGDAPESNVGDGTFANGDYYRVGADGSWQGYTFSPAATYVTGTMPGSGEVLGASVPGAAAGAHAALVWRATSTADTVALSAVDPTDASCVEELGEVALPSGATVMSAAVRGEHKVTCTK